MKTCNIEGCNNPIWGKGFCRNHIPNKKPLRSISATRMNDKSKQVVDTTLMQEFFLRVWNKREHKSIISNTPIYGDIKTIYLHHIFSKKKFPQYALNEENVVILLPDEHGNVESNPYRYEIINEIREKLKIKYNIL